MGNFLWRFWWLMNFRKDKRGGLVGPFMGLFVATIMIVVILFLFTLGAGVVKTLGLVEDGLMLRDVVDVGIGSQTSYFVSFVRVVRLRSLFEAEGIGFGDALKEAERMDVKKLSGVKDLRNKYVVVKKDAE